MVDKQKWNKKKHEKESKKGKKGKKEKKQKKDNIVMSGDQMSYDDIDKQIKRL